MLCRELSLNKEGKEDVLVVDSAKKQDGSSLIELQKMQVRPQTSSNIGALSKKKGPMIQVNLENYQSKNSGAIVTPTNQ